LIAVMVVMLVPFLNVIATSLATTEEIVQSSFLLWPRHISFAAYKYVFTVTTTTVTALKVSGAVTIAGTLVSMVLTTITAYALSFRTTYGRKYIMLAIVFTMLFNPGIIANYFAVKSFGLLDSYAAMIVPSAINVFYLLLMKNFFQEIPEEIKEAATIDGASLLGIFGRVILPLSKPALATFTLFYAVDRWNAFFDAVMYISTPARWPITVLLRQIVLMAQSSGSEDVFIAPVALRMATVTVAILPILALYPFLQRYFQSGLMVGSIKG
jgi:putative aldouronate transport system permease protein